MIVDLFAGPGGWDEGLRLLGRDDVVGIEWDADACATARAAGHERVRADVAALDPQDYPSDILVASPPCQAFSTAGRQGGKPDAVDAILSGAYGPAWVLRRRAAWGAWEAAVAAHESTAPDPDAPTLFPVEQSPHPGDPPPDPRGDLIGEVGRWALANRPRVVLAEQVPPVLPFWNEVAVRILEPAGYNVWTGILNAADYGVPQTRRRAFLIARLDGRAAPPVPTHDGRWVTLREALGELGEDWRWRSTRQPNSAVRTIDQPGPTIAFGNAYADCVWIDTDNQIIRRVRLDEAAQVQSFPAGYPWQGSMPSRYRQVADAVPPLLAAAMLRSLVRSRAALCALRTL